MSVAIANRRSAEVRLARSKVRARLATGQLSIPALMVAPPPELADRLVFEVLLMCRGVGRLELHRAATAAVVDGINLAVPLGRASQRTRAWVGEHVCPPNTRPDRVGARIARRAAA